MSDLVSVIIPTYNRSQFVTEAIDSVLCQTYPNIELIVVNDGSTDDTEEKLRPYMDRIIYIKKENGGPGSAINAGLRVAEGKYIARLDDDDLFMPDKIEKQVKVFEENPDVGLVTCGCLITDAIGRITSVRGAPDFSEYGPFLTLLLQYSLLQPAVMVRRECHDKVGLYKNTFAQDYDMFLRISRYWNVGVVDQPLAKCRRHSGNRTADASRNEELQRDIRNFVRDLLDDVPLTELFPDAIFRSDPYRESCAYAAKGALYLANKIFDRAGANFLKSLELFPANPIPLLWLGISARSQGDFRSAERYFNEIQENDELYAIAQNGKDLVTAVRESAADKDSLLLWGEIAKERGKLFRVTFDAVSGKAAQKTPSCGSADRLKLSRYTVIIDGYPQKGKNILFNTFTHAMVNVGDELKDFIHNPDRPVGKDALRNIRMLRKIGVLVNEGSDETKIVKKWYNALRSDLSRIYATVLTTYDCNFACKYCIEEGIKKPVYMDDRCSDALADWLVNRAEENETKEISLLFYGGEPLLNTGPIYRISEKLQRFAVKKGVLLSSSITTNGSMLNSDLLRDLTKYGLRSVKVTIDGVKEVHDMRRPFRSGNGSFDIIVGNIKRIPETVELIVQTNLDEGNIGDFPHLLDFFEESGLKDRIDRLTISPVAQSLGPTSIPAAQEMKCVKLSDSQIADELTSMMKLVVQRGFRSGYDSIRYASCGMNRNGSFVVIDPLGIVYNCPAFVGRKEFSIGDIYHRQLDRCKELSDVRLQECFQCTYFPVCGGGCLYDAYMLYGDHTRIACERSFIKDQTKELIKLIYDQKAKQKAAM